MRLQQLRSILRTSTASATATTTQQQQQQQQSNVHELVRQARQQQDTAKQQQLQHPREQQQQQLQQLQQRQRRQHQKQQTTTAAAVAAQRVAVLIPSSLHIDMMQVQQGFEHFVEFFQVHLSNASVDFIQDVDLSGFIKLLELPKYTSVVKTLNAGINIDTDVDLDGNGDGDGADPTKQPSQQRTQMKQLSADTLSAPTGRPKEQQQKHQKQQQNDKAQKEKEREEQQQQQHSDTSSLAHCHQLAEQLAYDYNKSALFWPCPQMKISSNFLPSFEAISLAVRSIASKLNWMHVDIYVGDDNWGLPLAIAANLHIPYRIEIGDTVRDLHEQDKPGQAIIITAPLNDDSTLRWLRRGKWTDRDQQTRVLLIDMVASSLNVEHRLYKYLARINAATRNGNGNGHNSSNSNANNNSNSISNGNDSVSSSGIDNGNSSSMPKLPGSGLVTSNLLVLTLLSDKHRHYLNAAGIGMAMVHNFRTPASELLLSDAEATMEALAHQNASLNRLRPFMNLFSLYDLLLSHITTGNATAGKPKYDFLVLDIVVDAALGSYKWRPLLILEGDKALGQSGSYITHSIQPGYDEWLLVSNAQIWHCGAICWTIAAICIGLLIIIVAASVAAGIAVRNYFLRKRLSKGPNKIVLSASDFVFPVDSRRVDEGIEAMLCCWLQQLQEFGGPEVDKPDLLKGSIGSLKNLGFVIPGATAGGNSGALAGAGGTATGGTVNGKSGTSASGSLARHKPAHLDMRARYNGDLVQLKEIPLNGSAELRSKAMDLLVMAHGLRHENINPLIGWLSDPSRTAMVFDYCSRGSLQDVLIMDEIKLDWSFRLSLLTDLVRGMRYLHASPLRIHGALTSRNCVVDARWVLKITDYGLNSFYEMQGLAQVPRSNKELLWTAPELLRTMKTQPQQQHHHHHHHQHGRVQMGTQMGDVYSFGIIMQEVVVRGEPYCMLSLSPDEIIAKLKKPPPLIRPSVSKGAAPPEAINIMRQCWAEQPDMRPDFNSVYERFKMLNHGRKVNFVDTMFQMLEKYSNNLEELIRERTDQLDIERKKTEQLLNRMLPSSVAEKLKMGLAVDPEEFSDVTIYFSDIVGFTTIAAHCSPVQVVDLLNDLYTIFDATINAYNVYKVETIGDAYMVVSGLPVKIPDHAEQIATMALDLLHQSGRFNVKHLPGVPLQLRIGLHTGPCCAGVVGLTMPRYCLFGDTVNTASRMESTGSSWRIHMSQETRDRLEARGGYSIEPRGLIDIKGKGMMNTFWLLGKKGFEKPLPVPPPIGESHGLDESLIRNSITQKAQANKSRTSTNPSSSQSSSLAGETVEVKVEITPPSNTDLGSSVLPNSYSLDSTSTNTISPNTTLCPEFPNKTPSSTSPQSRKLSELTPDSLLNPNSFNRLPSSTGGSSSRLYKKIEEMMDLSSPYNHYKCLSPSESNLTQFYDGKYMYGNSGSSSAAGNNGPGSGGCSVSGSTSKFDSKPGSSRLLRRQFSLDRDDQQSKVEQQHQHSLQASNYAALMNASKNSMLDIPMLHDTSRSPKGTLTRAHKQNSASIAQDLEKIEEIPLSPASSQHHSSLDSNLNRSPPSTLEAQPPPAKAMPASGAPLSPPLSSAPTSPAPSRTLNGLDAHRRSNKNNNNNSSSIRSESADSPNPARESNIPSPEIVLNVEQLLSR
ncbi:uncharacterized protein LOC6573483 [Drosophila mojavensis]|uniref:uncharacterized protein LOC6573483 n=1 Tax=Drosophila mojavensis TaxID=7230 RepID=UPI001CD0FC77|nr:uncharacterized protein LOC6573483 [Drosophila mojavensis]